MLSFGGAFSSRFGHPEPDEQAEQKSAVLERPAILARPGGIKTLDGRTGEGYASIFEVVDAQHDVVLPGAFRRTLAERSDLLPLLHSHKHDDLIGFITEAAENQYGLYISFQLLAEKAERVAAEIRSGYLSGLSIGWHVARSITRSPTAEEERKFPGVQRMLSEVDLHEVSCVRSPANSNSRLLGVKTWL
jgi:uncharacterized protein